ncbi:hypothetical protein C7212DRAFT_340694 [Tuber magnatum]|uniref:Pali-domain-containing protein n=1 Tax=Tuber magnatum TaxID=42249 RepID=A0A317T3Z7_9PEZI|nr:hypothetical protein C7212DRAFT_340694 [Tuber magnatum]
MVFITTWARVVTSFCLLMALILTAFLISGSTNESSGVRALYNIELKWTEPTTTTASPETTALASVVLSIETETQTTTASQKTTTRLSSRVATSTVSRAPLTTEAMVAVTRGGGALAVRGPAVPTGAAGPREVGGPVYEPERIFERRERANVHPPAGKGKRPHLTVPRTEHVSSPKIHQILRPRASQLYSNATVLVSYFGLCTYTPETQWHCTSRRTVGNSSSPLPPPLHVLSKALQKALSPLPPILTITSLGLLLLMTIALIFVAPRAGTHRTILGQVYLGVGLLAVVAGVFSAVLFCQSGLLVFAVLDGMQLGGDGRVSVRKGGSGIAVAWAAVFFDAVGFLGVLWLVLFASGDITDRGSDGGSVGSSIFARIFGGKKDEQGQELEEDIGRGRNSPDLPQDVHLGLRGGDITISAPMEVRRDVHPLRGNFRRESHPPSREVGGGRGMERTLSVGSVSSVSALSDSSSVRGANGGRQESTISAVSDITTVAGSAGGARLGNGGVQNMRRGNSPFPGGWNMI